MSAIRVNCKDRPVRLKPVLYAMLICYKGLIRLSILLDIFTRDLRELNKKKDQG